MSRPDVGLPHDLAARRSQSLREMQTVLPATAIDSSGVVLKLQAPI